MEEKPSSAFNREHVLPTAFGSFEHALVLHDAVCSACNDHFGKTVDLVLARGSDEGLQRYLLGVRPTDEVSRFRYDALAISYHHEDDYHGALIRLVA